ncbi:MAG: hypothetical protein ACK5T7_18275 [Gemmatimonas sp.]
MSGDSESLPAAAVDFGASNTDVVIHAGATVRHWRVPSEGHPSDDRVRAGRVSP